MSPNAKSIFPNFGIWRACAGQRSPSAPVQSDICIDSNCRLIEVTLRMFENAHIEESS